MSVVEKLLTREIKLPSPPAIALRILEIVKRDEGSFKHLAAVIQSDPALASKILRLVNSGFYCRSRKIAGIDTAVGVLGVNAVKNIALSFVLSECFSTQKGQRFDFDRFWRRSITSAVASELICKAANFKSDEVFITALLQDIGIAVMVTCRTEDYLRVLDEKVVTGLPVETVEKQIFGFDHQEVGSELLKAWQLPEGIYLPILYHHRTEGVPQTLQPLCNVLRASDRISATYNGTSSARNVRNAREMLSTTFNLPEERVAELIDSVAEHTVEVLSQFDLEQGGIKPFSQILQQANEELGRLNLSYEMLVMEYRQAKIRAELLASELKKANEKLNDLAFRDGLTGLYNHRYFQEALFREIEGAIRYKRSLALIMLDIDHFKKINDQYGHQQGDLVLKVVGAEIMVRMRKSDLVARYGGDEIAIILPETSLSAAMALGEVCRMAVGRAIQSVGVALPVTVSVGVAAMDASRPPAKNQLIGAADAALYRSKQSGRNRVTAQSGVTYRA